MLVPKASPGPVSGRYRLTPSLNQDDSRGHLSPGAARGAVRGLLWSNLSPCPVLLPVHPQGHAPVNPPRGLLPGNPTRTGRMERKGTRAEAWLAQRPAGGSGEGARWRAACTRLNRDVRVFLERTVGGGERSGTMAQNISWPQKMTCTGQERAGGEVTRRR